MVERVYVGDVEGTVVTTAEKTLNANAAPGTVDLFTIVGSVKVLSLILELTNVTVFTNCTNAYFDVDDGAVTVALGTGAVMSGFAVGGKLIKDDVIANACIPLDADQVRVRDGQYGQMLRPAIITGLPAPGVNTVRFQYTTTDAPMNAKAVAYIKYVPLTPGSYISLA